MSQQLSEITVAEFFADPQAHELLVEYGEECRLAGLPEPVPHRAIYEALEKAGVFTLIAVRSDARLIGFMALLVSMNPHYSQILGATESIFVASRYRKTGAGLALLREAQRLSREKGAVGLLVSAPVGSKLDAVLACGDWHRTNHVYLQVL